MDLNTLKHNWDEFARYDPMWAILTDPKRRYNKWKANDFFETGLQEITALMNGIQNRGYQFGRQKALDFGCGIGRLTQALTLHFDRCYGVDISTEMVELAKRFNRFDNRCQYIVNGSDSLPIFQKDFFDFIYTDIVMQHIERKYNESYLREFIRILKPDGLLVFQLPSSKSPEYDSLTMKVDRLLKVRDQIRHVLRKLGVSVEILYRWGFSDIPAVMEMHCFERTELEEFIKKHGGTMLDVERFDMAGPGFISYRYYVTKES